MNWIGIIINLLKVLTVLVSILIVFVVLLQRPKNEGLGAAFGGETASNIFGAQTTNVLATLTRWLGGIFLGLCLLIAFLSTRDKDVKGIVATAIEKSKAVKAEKEKQEQAKKDAEKAAQDAAAKAIQAGEAGKQNPEKIPPTPAVQPKPAPGAAPLPPATPEAAKPTPAAEPAKPAAPEAAKPATAEPPAPQPAKPATPEPAKPAEGAPKPQQ